MSASLAASRSLKGIEERRRVDGLGSDRWGWASLGRGLGGLAFRKAMGWTYGMGRLRLVFAGWRGMAERHSVVFLG